MAETVTVPQWKYHDDHIEAGMSYKDFTRGDRTIIYTSPTPLPGQKSSQMQAVGMIQAFSDSESKQIQMVFELGSAIPMLVPGLTQGQLSVQRVLLNGNDFLNTIYHGPNTKLTDGQILRSIRDVNRPFDLMMARYPVLEDEKANAQAMMSTLFAGCQIQARQTTVSAGGTVTMENLSILYTNIPKATFNYEAAGVNR